MDRSPCTGRRAWLRAGAACLALAGGAARASPPVLQGPAGVVVPRQLRFALTLSNPFGRELGPQRLWMYLPLAETPTQRLVAARISGEHRLHRDPLRHTVLELPLDRLAPYGARTLTLLLDLEMRDAPLPGDLPERAAWLAAERYIEADAPAVRRLAAQLRRADEAATARAIYDWVRQGLSYAGYVESDQGAQQALLEGRGDCTEYAYLVVALARACGIPGRMVGGFVVDANAAPKAEDYHNWAELHWDGAWRLVDAQKGHWLSPAEHYVAFRHYRDRPVNPIGLAHRFRVEGEMQVRL